LSAKEKERERAHAGLGEMGQGAAAGLLGQSRECREGVLGCGFWAERRRVGRGGEKGAGLRLRGRVFFSFFYFYFLF